MKKICAFIVMICIVIGIPVLNARAYTPKLIISDYSIDVDKVIAGEDFNLTLTMDNTSKTKLKNIKITVSSEAGEILPVDGTGSMYMGELAGQSSAELAFTMCAALGLDDKPYKLNIKMEYEDGYGNPYTMEDSIFISVSLKQRLSVTDILSDGVKVGDDVEVTASVNNLGEGMLYNVSAKVEGEHVNSQESYIGNIESGKSGAIDIITKTTGVTTEGDVCKDKLIITYEDKEGNKNTESFDLWLSIATSQYENLEILKEKSDSSSISKQTIIVICVCVVVIAFIVWKVIMWRRKKKRLEEF